ncbi:MAG: hypothetical protein M1819_003500 [Sarea resinae]|nr:MAG: hypothetical protein M1819_003500 [Sarea resinae]
MGGLLVNPTTNYPSLFGPNSAFGGKSGIRWMSAFPYALPSIICSIMLFLTATSVYLALEETLESRKYHFDSGIYITQRVSQLLSRLDPSSSSYPTTPSYQQTTSSHAYTQLELDEPKPATSNYPNNSSGTSALQTSSIPEDAPLVSPILNEKPRRRPQLPLRRIWTKNVLCTLLAQAFFDFHMGAFNNLILLFLSTPRPTNSSPLSGGLALPPPLVGLATSLLGILGLPLQLLFYPPLHALLGTTLSYRLSLPFFIPAYALAPLIGFLPSSTPAPGAASGFLVWAGLVAIVGLQVGARTFSLPTSIILLNNCSPHPSVLGTVHGLGQSVSSVARTLGPVVVGRWFGAGLKASREAGDEGVGWGVGGAWWGTAAVAALGAAVAWFVREGSGHEIFVEGDFDEYDAGGGGGGGGEDREVEMELGGFREVEMRGTGRGWAGGGVHSA